MKKSVVVLGGAVILLALGGGFYAFKGRVSTDVAVYWDGKSELNRMDAEGRLPLITAVTKGDYKAVSYLLEKGADVDVKNKDGVSALAMALALGNEQIFSLLAASSKADWKEPVYLNKAIESGNAAIVAELLKRGADVNAVLEFKGRKRPDDVLNYLDPRVTTPLKKAVEKNKADVVRVLAANGAEGVVYFLGENLKTADFAVVEALAENAGDLRSISVKGMDLLTYAASDGSPQLLEFLLKKNAGDLNKALMRVLTQRKAENGFDEAVEMFVRAGAMPSMDALALELKNNKTELFKKLAGCYAHPNMMIPEMDEDVMMYAVRNGKTDLAAWLLERGADIWKEYKNGVTPIKTALSLANEHPEMAELFEKQVKEVNETGYAGETLLMMYAESGDANNFQRIINKGGNLWQRDNDDRTLMMYAAKGGNLKILEYFLAKGDNVLSADKSGRTPLMYAAERGKATVVKYLADRGADISAQDNDGKAAIMYAAEKGYSDIVDMLINMGESAAVSDSYGRSALMYAVKGGNMAVVDTLLMKGVDVQAVDEGRMPVLSYAVLGGNAEIVAKIVKLGGNIFALDDKGYTPIMYALKEGKEDIYRLLDSDVMKLPRQAKADGKSLGILAVEGGNDKLIKYVLSKYKDLVNVPDNDGRTFLMLVAGNGKPEIVREALISRPTKRMTDKEGKTVLMYAAEKSVGVSLLSVLGGYGDEINFADNAGRTPLMYAVGYENNQPVKMHMLLRNKANVTAADKEGKTVLMYAVGNPYSRVDAKSLVELVTKAKPVDAKDSQGRTALMYAAANPRASGDVAVVLLNAGADVNAADKNGKTVLMYAMESGDIGKVRLLLDAGAKTDVKTADGRGVKEFINPEMVCFKTVVESLL